MPAVMEAIDRMTTSEKFETMEYLWSSLYSLFPENGVTVANPSIQAEWLETAKRRRAAALSGTAQTISTSTVLAEARARAGR